MADTKITGLAELTSVSTGDLLAIVSGTSTTLKVTVENLQADWHVGARVYNSGNISINNNSWTYLTFDSERYDTDTIHNVGANTGRLTATTAGVYLIIATLTFAANATNDRAFVIQLNRTTNIASTSLEAPASTTQMGTCAIWNMSATDYVEVQTWQNSGGALNVLGAASDTPEFMMTRIG